MKKLVLTLAVVSSFSSIAVAQETKGKGKYEVALEKSAGYYQTEKQIDEEIDLAIRTEGRGPTTYKLYINAQPEPTCKVTIFEIKDEQTIHACGGYKLRTFIDRSEYKLGMIYFQIFADKNPEKVLGEATVMYEYMPLKI